MPDRIEVRATRNGRADYIEVPTAQENLVAALRRERAGYVVRGLPDRVAQVDAQLAALGVVAPTPDTDTSTPKVEETNHDRQERGARRRHRQRPAGEAAAGNG